MVNQTLLERLIEEDYGIEYRGDNWCSAVEHDSLVVDRRKQIFFFNSREVVGDSYIYLLKIRKWNHKDIREYLKANKCTETFIETIGDPEDVVVYPKLVEVFEDNLQEADKEYFYKRTITDQTIKRFRLGLNNGYYMIPFYQDGLFRQFQMRRDSPKAIRNYYKGVGGLLFNSDILKITNKIVIVEGPTSCLVLNQNGIPSVSSNTGAGGWMDIWFKYFIHQKEVVVLYDNDSAGISGARKIAKNLGLYKTKIYCFEGFKEHYDANDFFIDGGTTEQLLDVINEKSKYAFEMKG